MILIKTLFTYIGKNLFTGKDSVWGLVKGIMLH